MELCKVLLIATRIKGKKHFTQDTVDISVKGKKQKGYELNKKTLRRLKGPA